MAVGLRPAQNWPTNDAEDGLERVVCGPVSGRRQPAALYAGDMGWVILLVVVVAVVVAWKMRVKLLAKILGQPESRIDRQLNRKK